MSGGERRRVRQAIVVEGKYDVIRVQSAVDALVIPTDGFGIFRDREKMTLLRRLAESRGLIILTDSDSAGAVIRNHLIGAIPADRIRQAYVPPTPGKERRKASPSREGLLGVEGIAESLILAALERAGADFEAASSGADTGAEKSSADRLSLTRADLYEMGLTGHPDSAVRRRRLLAALELPQTLNVNRLIEVLNATVTRQELAELLSSDLEDMNSQE